MNKADIIGKLATDADITKAQAEKALNSFTEAVSGPLSQVLRSRLVRIILEIY